MFIKVNKNLNLLRVEHESILERLFAAQVLVVVFDWQKFALI